MNPVINCICELPTHFRQNGNKSVFEILDESDALSKSRLTEISRADLERHLRENPELVDNWFLWSEDQRCTPSHYVLETESGYEFCRYPNGIKTIYKDRTVACAEFIVRFIDSLLDSRHQA